MSTTIVDIVSAGRRAQEIAAFTARAAFSPVDTAPSGGSWSRAPPPLTEKGKEFMKRCQTLVEGKASGVADYEGFISTIVDALPQCFRAGVSEHDIEGCFTIVFSFLPSFPTRAAFNTMVQRLSDTLVSSTDYAALRLRIMGNLYNFIDNKDGLRVDLFCRIVDYASSAERLDVLKQYFATADDWQESWNLEVAPFRDVLARCADALEGSGNGEAAQEFLIRYLRTFESADDAELRAAVDVAKRAAVGYIKSPVISERSNLIDFKAVKQLATVDPTLFELLSIFAFQTLDKFKAFYTANKAFVDGLGVAHDESVRTMRLLTLCSLASEGEIVSYEAVSAALEVEREDVEMWIVEAISLELLDGRLDQIKEEVVITRWTQRAFGPERWKELQSRLAAWQSNISALLSTVQAARAGAGTA